LARLAASLVLTLLFLVSCDQSANRVSTLWTNVPELTLAVEKFNASQREWQILVEYKEDPAMLLTGPGVKADLVVARGLGSSAVKNTLVSLDFLFDGGNLAKSSFYHRSLDAGQQNDRIKLLPVSFDLPVLVYSKKLQPDLPGFSLGLEDLKALNERFTPTLAAKVPQRLAFSPRWESFGTTFLQWSGAGFKEGFQGELTWDTQALTAGLALFQSWPSPGWDQVTEFQRKYLRADPRPSLASGRIQFYTSTLATFMNLPWRERRDLDFRFLEQSERAMAADNLVWAGIPSSSLTRGAGERFLAWFFQASNQKALMVEARAQDDRSFGLAQGLSSLVGPNEGALVEVYPELLGRLPRADQVAFAPPLPLEWSVLKTSVLKPWLETQDATVETLRIGMEKQRSQAVRH